MNEFMLERGDPYVALSHLALYGLAAILEDAGCDLRLSWTGQLRTRPRISSPTLDDEQIGHTVREHAVRLADPDAWLSRDITLKGTARGLMSPRLTLFPDQPTWQRVQRARHSVLDRLTDQRRLLDLRFLAALGEPAYWSRDNKDRIMQDDGASRWEMQPRNQGSEIVGSRLRKLAAVVADRSAAAVVAGLRGEAVRDEIGGDKPDSRTPTGLAAPGPTDNAVAWCALWGISQLPIAMRISTGGRSAPALTSGHFRQSRSDWFYLPVWHQPWRPARLRTVLASAHLRTAAGAGLTASDGRRSAGRDMPSPVAVTAARGWLAARGVVGVIRFPIERFGSDNAPERRAMRGELVTVGT
jgi:CRISPR-associated protein Csb3